MIDYLVGTVDGRARFKEGLNSGDIALDAGNHHGRTALLVLDVHLGLVLDQQAQTLRLAFGHGDVQGCLSLLVCFFFIYVSSPRLSSSYAVPRTLEVALGLALEEREHGLLVATGTGQHQRRHARLVLAVHVDAQLDRLLHAIDIVVRGVFAESVLEFLCVLLPLLKKKKKDNFIVYLAASLLPSAGAAVGSSPTWHDPRRSGSSPQTTAAARLPLPCS